MNDKEKHDKLVEQLKEKCGQPGANPLVGWSIRDCLDDPDKKDLMQEILNLREKLEVIERGFTS